jgi:hypothetical protein
MVDIYKLVEPQYGDMIIVEVDMSDDSWLDIETVQKIHQHIQRQFPFNSVITVPNYFSLDLYSKEEAIKYLEDLLQKIREEKL